jgi:hypothetical protein
VPLAAWAVAVEAVASRKPTVSVAAAALILLIEYIVLSLLFEPPAAVLWSRSIRRGAQETVKSGKAPVRAALLHR